MIATVLLLTVQLSAITISPPPSLHESPPRGPIAAAPLTLSAAVSRAMTDSPRRRAAASVAEGARDAARYAGQMVNPFFELRTENWTPSTRSPSPTLDVFAVITQPLELGGKRTLRRQVALSESELAQTALTALERNLALETVHAYVAALRARALVDTLTANRDGLTTLVASVGRRVDEGYSAEVDLLKFETEAARIDGDVARARLELERSLTTLGVVIGSTIPIDASQLVEPERHPVPLPGSDAIAASIARHPAVIAATASVARARQMSALERARRLPEPAISGGYKRTAGYDTAVLGVSFAIPLFDRNRTEIARSMGVERGATADRDAVLQQITAHGASAIRIAQTIADQADRATQHLLEPAEGVRRATLAAFREGTADVLKLIDAERVYADVHRAAIELRLDALLATIEARFAIGEETIP